MMRSSRVFYCCVLWSICVVVKAQSTKIPDVTKLKPGNMGALFEGDQLTGYYFLHTLSKAQKGQKDFRITVFDKELEVVAKSDFTESKNLTLVEGSSSEAHILLKFIDPIKSRQIMMTFNAQGEMVSKSVLEKEKKNPEFPNLLIYGTKQQPIVRTQMIAVPSGGFLNYMPWGDGTQHVSFLPLPGNEGTWEYVTDEPMEDFSHLAVTDQLLLNNLVIKSGKKDKSPDLYIQAINMTSGKEHFRLAIEDQYQSQPLAAFSNQKGEIQVVGLYFEAGKSSAKTNPSLGLFRYKIDQAGNLLDKKFVSWASGIAQKLNMNKKGKVAGGYLYFHDILPNQDDTYTLVAEQFRRTADAAGIAFSMLSNNASMTKMVVEDLVLLTFNAEFELQAAKTIAKEKRNFDLHGYYAAYYSFSNVHGISRRMKAEGGFDFEFVQKLGNGALAVHYRSTLKQKGADLKYLGTAIQNQDAITVGQTPLEWRTMKILPGKMGHVAIFRMDYREKALHINVEKISPN